MICLVEVYSGLSRGFVGIIFIAVLFLRLLRPNSIRTSAYLCAASLFCQNVLTIFGQFVPLYCPQLPHISTKSHFLNTFSSKNLHISSKSCIFVLANDVQSRRSADGQPTVNTNVALGTMQKQALKRLKIYQQILYYIF